MKNSGLLETIDRMRLNHERAKVVWIRRRNSTERNTPDNPLESPKGGIMLEETQNVTYRTESAKLEATDAKNDGLALLYYVGAGVNTPLHILVQMTSESKYSNSASITGAHAS